MKLTLFLCFFYFLITDPPEIQVSLNITKIKKNNSNISNLINQVESPVVYSGEGQEAMLVCIVHGEAQPEVNKNEVNIKKIFFLLDKVIKISKDNPIDNCFKK